MFVELVPHPLEVGHRPVERIDFLVVGYIVTEIVLWREENWRKPHCPDAYSFEITDFFRYA